MADIENKMARIAYINKSQSGDGSVYGRMLWDGATYRIRNIDQDPSKPSKFCADVLKETDEQYTDRMGVVRNRWEIIGAIRWDTENGTGDYVTEIEGITVKYPLTNSVEDGKYGATRVLKFKTPSANKFRTKFDSASEVVDEQATAEPSGIDDEVPF